MQWYFARAMKTKQKISFLTIHRYYNGFINLLKYSHTKKMLRPFLLAFCSMLKNIGWLDYNSTEIWKMAVFSTDFVFGNFILPNLQTVRFWVETDSCDESPERVLMVKEISSEMLYKKWGFLLRIWSHLLKKSLMGNFIFCTVIVKETSFEIQVKESDAHLFRKCSKSFKPSRGLQRHFF